MDRRRLLGGAAALAAVGLLPAIRTHAHTDENDIGFGVVRARKTTDPAIERAVTMDALANFLPGLRSVAGYKGYVLATDVADPSISIPLWLLENEAAEAPAQEVAAAYVADLHPAITVENVAESRGPLRVMHLTERERVELPPALHGVQFGMRIRENAPGTDVDALVAKVKERLIPMLAEMPGFIAYIWMQTENGRTAINLWDTAEQQAAGDQAISDWVAANSANTTVGDPIAFAGVVDYAEITTMHS